MAWIESHQTLGQHPKTRRLARCLGISLPAAVGHLHYLWWWALDYARDGDLSKFEPEDIAGAALWEGDATAFIEALVKTGFVDRDEEGLAIHDWGDYAGRLIEQREKQARRRELYADTSLTRAVRARDGDRCRYCGKVVDWKNKKGENGGTYDHVDPNGPNTADNIVVACRGCSSKKKGRTPEETGMSLLPV
ncbi:MAG: HNH endonuclease [Clostridia bacterium]|nr:MAG: HNH endonuclease [Clostridia bacterium]